MCVTSCLLALAFVYGLWQGSFWVLAIPVALGVLTGLWLLFWIGYTIATIRVEPTEDFDEPASPNAREPGASTADSANSSVSSTGDAAG